jgi:hypothetical protein
MTEREAAPADDQDVQPTPAGRSVWWVVFALVVLVGLAVAAFIAFGGDPDETPPPQTLAVARWLVAPRSL